MGQALSSLALAHDPDFVYSAAAVLLICAALAATSGYEFDAGSILLALSVAVGVGTGTAIRHYRQRRQSA